MFEEHMLVLKRVFARHGREAEGFKGAACSWHGELARSRVVATRVIGHCECRGPTPAPLEKD